MLYIEWDGLVAFLDCWTGTLKGNAEFLAIQEVVSSIQVPSWEVLPVHYV